MNEILFKNADETIKKLAKLIQEKIFCAAKKILKKKIKN